VNTAVVETAIKSVLDAGLLANSITATVQQANQPTQQGAPFAPIVLFTNLFSKRFGYQSKKLVHASPDFTKTEAWYLEATYQFNALMNQNPNSPVSLSAFDVIDICAAILQTDETRDTFLATDTGIGIQRITDIRVTPIQDDSDRWVKDPSFDVVLSYRNTLTNTVPEATVSGIIERV